MLAKGTKGYCRGTQWSAIRVLPTEEIANATIVSIQISKKKNSAGSGLTEIVWEVLEDGKHIEEDDNFDDLRTIFHHQ